MEKYQSRRGKDIFCVTLLEVDLGTVDLTSYLVIAVVGNSNCPVNLPTL